jgi:flagellar motor switch protein FliM
MPTENEPILNQEEVDALLSGMSEGRVSTEQADVPGEARRYDIGREVRILRGRMPTFDLINERFCRTFRESVVRTLRRPAQLSVAPFRTLKYSEFIAGMKMPTGINVLRMAPLRGSALLVMTAEMVTSLVDNYFGGRGEIRKISNRDFTSAESRIIQVFREVALKDITDAWTNVVPLKAEFSAAETNPLFATVMNPNEVLLVSDYTLEIMGGKTHMMIAIPYSMIEPIRGVLEKTFRDEVIDNERRLARSLREEMKDAEVTLNALVGRSHLSVSKLLDLKAGDVIPCDFNGSVLVYAEDVPVFRGQFGASRGQLSVRVDERFVHGRSVDLIPEGNKPQRSVLQ